MIAAACAAMALSGVAAASADAFTCQNRTFTLEHYPSAAYVSTLLSFSSYPGMLRVRTESVGLWEKYRMHCRANGEVAIRSLANDRYVSAEFGYGGTRKGMLRARSESVGEWERFVIHDFPGGGVRIKNAVNWLYVSTELGYASTSPFDGMLRARTSIPLLEPWSWERFGIVWR